MPGIRQLAAIMFTDIAGYTTLMGRDEEKAFELLEKNRQIHKPITSLYNGTLIKELGDGTLISFPTATDAVLCAYVIRQACNEVPGLQLHIGIHQGEVVFDNADIFGDGVNLASRLQAMAPPGEIWVSEAVYNSIRNKAAIDVSFVGERALKNVAEPMKIYEVKKVEESALNSPKAVAINKSSKEIQRLKIQKPAFLLLGLVLLLAVVSFYYFRAGKDLVADSGTAGNTNKSIAVLPFTNMSNDPSQAYFADGIMNEILNHLFKIGGWRIVSRTSVMAFKESRKTTKEMAKELNVNHLLEGSVQKSGERVRISVRLINGTTDQQVWGENYDKEYRDIFSIQSDIAQKVAAALRVNIDPGVRERIVTMPTQNTEAYALYLKAKNSPEPDKKVLEQALSLDPNFADAYAELAYYWLLQGGWFGKLERKHVLGKAMPLLQKALKLNPDLVSAHTRMAELQLWFNWNFDAVEEAYRKVLLLDPSNPEITGGFLDYLLATGRYEEVWTNAVSNFNNDKKSRANWITLATAYQWKNHSQKALQTLKTAESLFPNDQFMKLIIIRVNLFNKQYETALQAFHRLDSGSGLRSHPENLGHIAVAYHKTGQHQKAQKLVNELKHISQISPVGSPSFHLAAVYTAMGENSLAIQSLEKAFTDHEVEIYWLKVYPLFQALHDDARFQNIVSRVPYPQ